MQKRGIMQKSKIEYLKDYLNYEIYIIDNGIKENVQNIVIQEGKYSIIKNKKELIHIVKPNESLKMIADKYNKTEEEIYEKNKVRTIFIGQQLLI